MKLIDLDKAVSICDEDNNAVIFSNIKNAGVKAIPIKWMYEWRMKNNEQYNVGVSSFSQMISDWEKENGRSE